MLMCSFYSEDLYLPQEKPALALRLFLNWEKNIMWMDLEKIGPGGPMLESGPQQRSPPASDHTKIIIP
ncbi:hypothetical protein Y032_0021g402 [Ancylostoma ceylanicum]|uniref:Uncharacterized protein n=1 Tax=Ancylostoma ceylanicum TaxID=53326 RepID=A0A016V159_9BILA|nr:hypothetical protein Y032_0021g402 [Ancylostoma ceylanicum]